MMIYALHGFLGSPLDWQAILPKGKQTCMDLFEEKSIAQPSLRCWAERFISLVEKDGHSSRILCGYSLGGRLALHALSLAPKLWSKAIFLSTHLGLEHEEEKQLRVAQDKLWAERFLTGEWEPLLAAWNSQKIFERDLPLIQKKTVTLSLREAYAAALQNWSLGLQRNFLQEVNSLQMPILWLTGEHDRSSRQRAKKISFSHSNSIEYSVPGAGHRLLNYESQIQPLISNFLEG